ncbi:MAG: FAD-dependent oxidoreductase [Candidatus Woesearchaeota archaeon]
MAGSNSEILILGGGPAGMACAMELHKAGKVSAIIEKNKRIGGLAKTFEIDEGGLLFRTDIGPHRFFSKNKYLYDFIEDLLDEKWKVVKRQTRQFIDGKYYDYPINAMQAFRNIGLIRATGMGLSYFASVIKYRVFKKKINNFEDYIVANFGRKLGEFNMLNYTEKIWGLDCRYIHPDWARQRIKGLNLRSAVIDAIFKKKGKEGPKSLVDQFYYPQYGTGLIYETIAEKIKKVGTSISTESRPTKIFHDGEKITKIEIDMKGKKRLVQPSDVVSSVPITEFIKLMSPRPSADVFEAAKSLKWRAQIYLFITLDKEKITDDNWIYFPNSEIPFGRIAEMKNFSKDMSPEGKTSLFVEFFVTKGDSMWNRSKKEVFDLAMKHFEKLKLFSKDEVRNYYVFRKKFVYPVYDIDYPDNIKVIKEYLDKFDNLYYIGRPGRFQYTNQDHSLEMGILAARSIIENRKYNLDDVGSEKEYFESGYIKN